MITEEKIITSSFVDELTKTGEFQKLALRNLLTKFKAWRIHRNAASELNKELLSLYNRATKRGYTADFDTFLAELNPELTKYLQHKYNVSLEETRKYLKDQYNPSFFKKHKGKIIAGGLGLGGLLTLGAVARASKPQYDVEYSRPEYEIEYNLEQPPNA